MGMVFELKAKREDKRDDKVEEGFAVVQELKVRRFVMEIDNDSAMLSHALRRFLHGVAPCKTVLPMSYPEFPEQAPPRLHLRDHLSPQRHGAYAVGATWHRGAGHLSSIVADRSKTSLVP